MAKPRDILNVDKIVKKFIRDWNLWISPLGVDKEWYSRDWFNETLEALEGGKRLIKEGKVIFLLPDDLIRSLKDRKK
jgi:hypothetical protein